MQYLPYGTVHSVALASFPGRVVSKLTLGRSLEKNRPGNEAKRDLCHYLDILKQCASICHMAQFIA